MAIENVMKGQPTTMWVCHRTPERVNKDGIIVEGQEICVEVPKPTATQLIDKVKGMDFYPRDILPCLDC